MNFKNYLQRAELISLQNFLKYGGETFIPTSNKKYSERLTEARSKAKNFLNFTGAVKKQPLFFCKKLQIFNRCRSNACFCTNYTKKLQKKCLILILCLLFFCIICVII